MTGSIMKVVITGKNVKADEKLKELIKKKLGKLGKYFSDDIAANVMLTEERGRTKIETTIRA